MFKDAVKDLMAQIIQDIQNLSMDSGLLASITRDGAYASLWSHVTNVAAGAFRTFALLILAIFMLVEFLELSDRFTSNQLPDLLKPIGILMVKFALSVTVINQASNFLLAIYNAAQLQYLQISHLLTHQSMIWDLEHKLYVYLCSLLPYWVLKSHGHLHRY